MSRNQKCGVGPALTTGAALTLAALAFLRPAAAAQGVAQGLSLCAKNVIPALFPLLVLSQLILRTRAAALFALPFRPYLRLLGIREHSAASAIAMGWLGGFACGAQGIGTLYRTSVLSRRDAEVLLCCTIGSGPAFVVSAVGTLMLNSTASGCVLLCALLSANLVSGLVAAFLLRPFSVEHRPAPGLRPAPDFVGAVQTAVQSMLVLCGFVVFFAFASSVFLAPGSGALAKWVVTLPLEVTNACRNAADSETPLRLYLCCASLSVMGASVLGQVRSLVPKDVRITPLLASRAIHLPVSLLFTWILLKAFPFAVPASAPARLWMPPDAATAVFLMLCVVLPFFPRLRHRKNCV